MRRTAPIALAAAGVGASLALALPAANADTVPTATTPTVPTTQTTPATPTTTVPAAPTTTEASQTTPTPADTPTTQTAAISTPAPPSPAVTTTTSTTSTPPAATAAPRPEATTNRAHGRRGLRHRRHAKDLRARIAGDPSASISDFKFAPATITVHVGDTITWTNSGPSPHTATASDGAFNTGILKTGQSASHTFTQAGTFAYICQIHPFMHGTVVVLASTTSTSSSPSSSTSASSGSSTGAASPASSAGSTATSASTGPSLPNTGFDALAAVVVGLVLLVAGLRIRRAVG